MEMVSYYKVLLGALKKNLYIFKIHGMSKEVRWGFVIDTFLAGSCSSCRNNVELFPILFISSLCLNYQKIENKTKKVRK